MKNNFGKPEFCENCPNKGLAKGSISQVVRMSGFVSDGEIARLFAVAYPMGENGKSGLPVRVPPLDPDYYGSVAQKISDCPEVQMEDYEHRKWLGLVKETRQRRVCPALGRSTVASWL